MSASRKSQLFWTVIVRFFAKSANLIALAILARALSVSDLGLYGFLFIASAMISMAFDAGTRNSVAFYMGRDPERRADFARYALLAFVPFGILSAIATPAVFLFHPSAPPMHVILAPVIVNTLSLLFIRMEQGILLGSGQISVFNRTEAVPRTVLLALTVGMFTIHEINLLTALYILAVANLSGAIAVAFGVLPTIRGGQLLSLGDTKRLLKRGIVFMLGVMAMFATQKISFLVIARVGSSSEMGLFYGAQRLTEVMTEIAVAVSVVLFSNNVRADSKERAIRELSELTRICIALFMLMGIAAYWLAPLLLRITLGEQYAGHAGLFRILLIGTFLGTIWTLSFTTLSVIEHPIVALLLILPNMIAGCILTLVLYNSMGLSGAAWAMVATMGGLSVSLLVAFKVRHGVRIRSFLVLSANDIEYIRTFRFLHRNNSTRN
ncbi:MAG: oligosaccharide flippase family protein [Actinomycetia bacterium]|nr:oligosaccharide flippase family protein [Actinomycetes bacterium]